MTTTIQQITLTDDGTEVLREIIRSSLDGIVDEVKKQLEAADLRYPVCLAVPNSGAALSFLSTPLDPSDDDWKRITKIVRGIISERLGGIRLRNRELTCFATNTTMGVADITAE